MAIRDKFPNDSVPIHLPSIKIISRLSAVVLAFLGWFALASVFPNQLMPYPVETIVLTWDLIRTGIVLPHLGATLWRTFWGFLGAIIVGTSLGILMGTNEYWLRFLFPYVVFGFALPAVVWAAISTLTFGIGFLAPVIATIAVTFPFISINVWKGTENIDVSLVEMSESFGVSKPRLLLRCIIPNTAPQLFSSLRFGLAISWKIVTVAEIFASTSGIGYKLIQAYDAYLFERAWAWALVFIVIILLIEFGIMRPLERRVFKYRPEADIQAFV